MKLFVDVMFYWSNHSDKSVNNDVCEADVAKEIDLGTEACVTTLNEKVLY